MLPGLAMNGMYAATEIVQEGANFRLFMERSCLSRRLEMRKCRGAVLSMGTNTSCIVTNYSCAVMALRHIPRGEIK